nr:hypothetical protein [Morchella crassipes]
MKRGGGGAPTPFLGTPPIAISVSLSYGGEMHLPPPLRPLSTFFFSIFNWKKKGGPRAISLLLGGARYARPPQQKEEGGSVPPRRGGDARGGAAPPLSLRSSWVAAVLGGGPHENPLISDERGLGGGFCIPWRSQGKGVGGEMQSPPPLPPPLHPPPFQKMGRGGWKGGMGGRGGGADSVLVCLRQTRDASPPTEGTVKAVRQPPRLWIFLL